MATAPRNPYISSWHWGNIPTPSPSTKEGRSAGITSIYSVAPSGAAAHSTTGAHATTTGAHATTTGAHAATPGTHAPASRWRLIRQGNAALLGPRLHLLVVFGADSFTLFLGFCRAHFGAVSRAFLLRHQLRAVYLLLVLSTNLVLLLRLILADNQR
jgi:hypothetical protein